MFRCNGEEILLREVPTPFFLSPKPFVEFNSPDYNWECESRISLVVKAPIKERFVEDQVDLTEDMSNVNIDGCPLECPFDPNENFDDALDAFTTGLTFRGIDYMGDTPERLATSQATARTLLKKIYDNDETLCSWSKLDKGGKKERLDFPTYILPRTEDVLSMDLNCALLGFDNGRIITVLVDGPFIAPQNIDMNSMLHYHCQSGRGRPPPIRQVHAIYEKIHGGYPAKGKVFIEFLWSDPQRVFEPPTSSSSVKLAIKPFQGDANPFLKKLWSEIETLERLIGLYEDNLKIDLNKSTHTMSMIEMNSSKLDELSLILNQQCMPDWEKMLDFSDSLETNLERVSNGDRTDVDFTDRVWRILAGDDTTVQDVVDCFHMIFSEVESKLFRPYLFPTNRTQFNATLKRLLSDNMLNFRSILSYSCALSLAIDCGLNKLFKDYSFVLRMCHLVETCDLDSFCPETSQLQQSLNSIKKLHCMLEILCLSKERLGVSMSLQESQTRKLFQYLASNDLDWNRTYHFDITLSSIGALLEGMIPIYWHLKLETRSELKVKLSNFVLTRDFYLDHVKNNFVTDDGILRSGYYMYFHQIASLNDDTRSPNSNRM